jgi:formylglycine-generating enzyme required for sulfatase activity
MGSSADEMVEALADCVKEPLPSTCHPELFQDEGPRHHVTLSAFWIDRYEVTVAAYARCVALRRCEPLPYASGAERFAQPELPVTLVRHQDAIAYCAFVGGQLPTEAQFERAARGDAQRRYAWGNLYNPRRANHGKSSFDTTDATDGYAELAPVHACSDGRTPEHVYNLAGNAEEWVLDSYAPYSAAAAHDPTGPAAGSGESARVVRGGGFRSAGHELRAAARSFAHPDSRSVTRGFRCAHSQPLPLP